MNTQITRWNPFKEFEDLQQRLASVWGRAPLRPRFEEESLTVAQWTPRVDISEDDKEFSSKPSSRKCKRRMSRRPWRTAP